MSLAMSLHEFASSELDALPHLLARFLLASQPRGLRGQEADGLHSCGFARAPAQHV